MKRNSSPRDLLSRFNQQLGPALDDESLVAIGRSGVFVLVLLVVCICGLLTLTLMQVPQRPPATVTPTPAYPTLTPTPVATPTAGPSPTPTATRVVTPPPPTMLDNVRTVLGVYLPWNKARHIIFGPLFAVICFFIASANFVQDIYALQRFKDALRHVLTLFGLGYPTLIVDNGRRDLREGEFNLIDSIGGPGYLVVQPGNVVLLRHLRRPTRPVINRSLLLHPFETIAHIANLDDQHGFIERHTAVTRDGIEIVIRDIFFRYRIRGKTRSLNDPYPFETDALEAMMYGLAATDNGLQLWSVASNVRVTAAMTDFVNTHSIDYLTAPRENGEDPRRDMRSALFSQTVEALKTIGTELLWIDFGHIDIQAPEVEEARTDFWAADWVGSAGMQRAYAEGLRQAFQEQGRAEAQAEMIVSIAGALRSSNLNVNSVDQIRRVILTRTAQVLDAMRDTNPNVDNPPVVDIH